MIDVNQSFYGYNQTSMLTGESAPAKTADLPALSQSYAFDAMGNRTQWSDGVAKTLTNAIYNRLNQLTGTSNYNNFRNSLNEHFSLFSRFSSPALMRRLRFVGRRRSA